MIRRCVMCASTMTSGATAGLPSSARLARGTARPVSTRIRSRSNPILNLALLLIAALSQSRAAGQQPATDLFDRDNLVAWCIVPFDAERRDPQQRARMLAELGIRKLAYDYRAEHIPTFDAEMQALKQHGIELVAWWFPTKLNDEARQILDVLKRHDVQTQLWVTGAGEPTRSADEQRQRVRAEAARIRSIAEAAAELDCQVGLYNHGGWFGDPLNQLAIIRELNLPNVGIVYNLHHGHEHLDRFDDLLARMRPHLLALNLNGMSPGADRDGRKIMPLGAGQLDLELLRTIRNNGYRGPIGILNHTDYDAASRLRDNLEGLAWLVERLDGSSPSEPPQYRTWPDARAEEEQQQVNRLLATAEQGDVHRGASVFGMPKFACLSCHKVGQHGGDVGPELTTIGRDRTAGEIVRAVLWPKRDVLPQYQAETIVTVEGQIYTGYVREEDASTVTLFDPAAHRTTVILREDIDERQTTGTLMPDGLATAMSRAQQQDLLAFLTALGRNEALGGDGLSTLMAHAHVGAPADFPYEPGPLVPEHWPNATHFVNRERLYDYYAKEAEYFRQQPIVPMLLPQFPGLDGGTLGHWGNQTEGDWVDNRWNETELGNLMCGIFRSPGKQITRAVCIRLGERGELSVVFDPDTLRYVALWRGDFVTFSDVRSGFLGGLRPAGELLPDPNSKQPPGNYEYHGFYRHGHQVLFAYSIDGVEYLDAPTIKDGHFERVVAPREEHPLRALVQGGGPQWPEALTTRGSLGAGSPYAVDTIELPTDNPWNALFYIADHDFTDDGTAIISTMQGEVWRVTGIDETLEEVRWRRFASGLHHPLGVVVAPDGIFVQCRDQLLRLHDLDGDGEADFYERISTAFETSPAGHDFICGLERDSQGNFYTASGNQGVVRISPDGLRADVLATGFRNPDGLGLLPDGTITVPCSEGEWTPASMLCAFTPQDESVAKPPHFGYRGPRDGEPPTLPLVYLPRGLDNSAGGQLVVTSDRWGPLAGQMLHFSFGMGRHFLVLIDRAEGQMQGAVVPLVGDFRSGTHRGAFNPVDGQLYVSGMAGWGTYTPDDGCFQRVRYTGDRVQLPLGFHVHENGVTIKFAEPVDATISEVAANHFAQCWNYRYSAAYGSPEFSPMHPGTPGHDPLVIASAHVLPDGHTLFVEMPDIQPVNQLHLLLKVDSGAAQNLFLTVHELDEPFTEYPGYEPSEKIIAAHPILSDMALASERRRNPWQKPIPGARIIRLDVDKNLTFATRVLRATAGETLGITLVNPDVVPHNWVLARPGTLQQVGQLSNLLVSNPEAVVQHYVPDSEDVLFYTDVVFPKDEFSIYFKVPEEPGRYPYLCTFPGHWMVMNGELIVAPAEE